MLQYHIAQAHIIAKKEQNAKNINPALIDIIAEHKIDILFSRQLRINRESKAFYIALQKSNEIVGDAFVALWVRELNLKITQNQLEGIFELAHENFYLQINSGNLNHIWLAEYFTYLNNIVKKFVADQ